jgi:hypothetical protein
MAQPKAVAIRDSVRLFLPTDVPCVELFNSVRQSIADNPAYRFAGKGEAALNVEFGCYVPKEMKAFVFTVVTALGRSIVWARQRSIYFALGKEEDLQKAHRNIMNEIEDQITDLRKVKASFEAIDSGDHPEEAEAEGFSRTDCSLILSDVRELLD